jgi:hypothetical protein
MALAFMVKVYIRPDPLTLMRKPARPSLLQRPLPLNVLRLALPHRRRLLRLLQPPNESVRVGQPLPHRLHSQPQLNVLQPPMQVQAPRLLYPQAVSGLHLARPPLPALALHRPQRQNWPSRPLRRLALLHLPSQH